MKKKYIFTLGAVMLLSILLSGCSNILELFIGNDSQPVPFTFRQERRAVKTVMICTYEDGYPVGPIMPILQLSEAQIDVFYNEMLTLEVFKWSKISPAYGYGDIIFLVFYFDGENEIISFSNLCHITPDGYETQTGCGIDQRGLKKVFEKFVSLQEFSKASGAF